MKVVRAIAVSKQYGERVALRKVDVTVSPGEIVALIGHNGSGKSTLLAIAAGLLEASDGEVEIAGAPAGSIEARAALSLVPDSPVLYDDLSLLEHLEYVAWLHGVAEWEERGLDLLERFRLVDRAGDLPGTFSRGMRQKAAIAIGLVRPFSVLAFDEPFVGLDDHARVALVDTIAEHAARGAAVVVATHDLPFADRVDRIVALRDGEVTYDGPAAGADAKRLVER